jgi:hypothetical protein
LSTCIPANYIAINQDILLSVHESATQAKPADDRGPGEANTLNLKLHGCKMPAWRGHGSRRARELRLLGSVAGRGGDQGAAAVADRRVVHAAGG